MAWRMTGVIGVAALLCLAVAPALEAAWQTNGVVVCNAAGYQYEVATVSDGSGGIIAAWTDYRNGSNFDIYAQRISYTGEMLWTANGVAVCTAAQSQQLSQIVSDGAGGAIVVWRDQRSGSSDIYAQRISSSGTAMWTANGVAVCTAIYGQENHAVASDGAGGAIVAWEDWRADGNIYAQRVSAAGATLWDANGIVVCNSPQTQYDPHITTDGEGGAIVAWFDDNGGGLMDIYAQRISASGIPLWDSNGTIVCANSATQYLALPVTDGVGGAIIVWVDRRDSKTTCYAQRMTPGGVPRWTVDGVPISGANYNNVSPRVIPDGTGGAFVSLMNEQYIGTVNLYAQRVDSTGIVHWGSAGVTVRLNTVYPGESALVADGTGGLCLVWGDVRDGSDIYAQRIDADGTVLWAAGGVGVCTDAAGQSNPSAAETGNGGLIAAWEDGRNMTDADIYAQGVSRAGGSLSLEPTITAVRDVPRDQGGKITLQWASSPIDVYPFTDITQYSVWRRLPAGAALAPGALDGAGAWSGVPIDFAGTMIRRLPEASSWAWEWLANVPAKHYEEYALMVTSRYDSMGTDPGWQYFVVTAHTSDPLLYYDSPVDSGYSVDNLSPCAPAGLAGARSYVPAGLALSWDANAESDLGRYRIYRGTSEEFIPAPDNLIGEEDIPSFFDEDWSGAASLYYKVSAIDVHGNESDCAVLRPEDVTGAETPDVPEASYLSQNFPNPFNPATRIAFGLEAPANVRLRVYDAAGRLVRTLSDGSRSAGHYTEIWDGRNARGELVASGVYFYRLEVGPFTQTRKMILAR